MNFQSRVVTFFVFSLFLLPLQADEKPLFPSAPDFPEGLEWLNTSHPLSLSDLRGRIVILDFWTYGCINCIHVMEELGQLKKKYGHKLVVVGVHSPKFSNEQRLDNLRHILERFGRDDPVVNDPDYRMMQVYDARAWPTLVLIGPYGNYIGKLAGEGHVEKFSKAIDELLKIHAEGIVDHPPDFARTHQQQTAGWFGAPEKIAIGPNRVAISDSLWHRIVVTDARGVVLHIIGDKQAGFVDGDLQLARFRSPRGLSFETDGRLLVADTGNHAIRRIDLKKGQVSTIAGTGRKAESLKVATDKKALELALRSPWDLLSIGSDLYIAMAGDHRIWRMNTASSELAPFAGSGHEGIDNGRPEEASFSQPSGLALQGDTLYVADAEASAIRKINLLTGRVDTLNGTGLFDFGDRDGPLETARLQHPQGIAGLLRDQLLVLDTYNHKLKRLDLTDRHIQTLPLGAEITLGEPAGLAADVDQVLIADTNNRRIISWQVATGKAAEWVLRSKASEAQP